MKYVLSISFLLTGCAQTTTPITPSAPVATLTATRTMCYSNNAVTFDSGGAGPNCLGDIATLTGVGCVTCAGETE